MAYLIGIGGVSGSGKGTFAKLLQAHFNLWELKSHILSTDDGYKDISYRSKEERDSYCFNPDLNFDHPDLLNFDKLQAYARNLKEGRPFSYHHYNFATHSYEGSTREDVPGSLDVAIIEGIYALYDRDLLSMYDERIFVDTDHVRAALRRVKRDVVERGREFTHVMQQIQATVIPMQRRYVMPTRANADDVVKWESEEAQDPAVLKATLVDIARQRAVPVYEKTKGQLIPLLPLESVVIEGVD